MSRVRLAPTRSATIPVPIRPKIDVSPDAPRMLAATILGTPWSIAWLTRWNRGPEWAAQQQKCVSAMAQNGQAAQGPPPPADRVARALGECGGHIGAPVAEEP